MHGKGLLIGVHGKARSGKDTFSEMLAEALFEVTGVKFTLMAFAHELKLRLQADYDMTYDQLWGDKKEDIDERYPRHDSVKGFWTPREMLQEYGEFFRSIKEDFWVDHLFRVIDEKEIRNVIITDVRLLLESNRIKDKGGYIIKICRKNREIIHNNNHITEVDMEHYEHIDFTIENDGDLTDLKKMSVDVAIMLHKLFKEELL